MSTYTKSYPMFFELHRLTDSAKARAAPHASRNFKYTAAEPAPLRGKLAALVCLCSGGESPSDPSPPNPDGEDGDTGVELEDKPITATPRRFKVLFHNDDYTTMEFVIEVLKRFFRKSDTEAIHIMLMVHKSGAAVAGVYTRDVAETKSIQVMDHARENGMPLLLTTEPE